jgi:two-component system, LytTR family, response regulator
MYPTISQIDDFQLPDFEEHLIVTDNRRKHLLPFELIVRLESKRVYTIVHVKNRKPFICSRNIKTIYEELQETFFFRIHKSHVINLHEVKAYKDGRNGQIVMSDDSVLMVSQRKRSAFLRDFQKLLKITTH